MPAGNGGVDVTASTKPPNTQLRDLVQRAQNGDQTAVPGLRMFLDAHPEVWLQAGDLAKQATEAWKQMIAGPDLLLAESLQRKLEAMKVELLSADPSPLETLLVDRIAACWLALHHAEATVPRMQGATAAQHVAAQKRINLAQQRYLHARKTLATMRKLLLPAVAPLDFAMRLGGGQGTSVGRLRGRGAAVVGAEN